MTEDGNEVGMFYGTYGTYGTVPSFHARSAGRP